MRKPVIAVDFDDVVGGFNAAFLAFHNSNYGSNIMFDQISDYALYNVYQVSRETIHSRIMHFLTNHHDDIGIIEGAEAGLQTLKSRYDLQIVTSRVGELRPVTEKWLSERLPGVFSDIHFTSSFDKILTNGNSKSKVCHQIGAGLILEDHTEHVIDANQNGIKTILFDKPWNQNVLPPDVSRVSSWPDATSWILSNYCSGEIG